MQIQQTDLELIQQFFEYKQANSVYRSVLTSFAREVSKPILECDELDVTKFLDRHGKTGGTWNSELAIIRSFYAWIHNKDKHLPRKKWKPPAFFDLIEWKKNDSDRYSVADIWTEDEILTAISVLDHPRDKAMIAVLYDLAARPHELMKLRIKDVAFKESYAQVKLVDHTGERTVPITFSYTYLLTWLNSHPLKEHPDAPLWVNLKGIPKKLGTKALYRLCTRTLKKRLAHTIHKPYNPYCLGDHSRLTNLVERGLSEFELKRFRGWTLNSTMPKRYVQMSGRGLNDKLLELAGIKKPEQNEKQSPLKAKECYRCKHKNPPDSKLCEKCSFVLSAEAFEEMQEKEKEREEQLQDLRKFAGFQMHMFSEHGGRPSNKCELCKRLMEEMSSSSLGHFLGK